jgi:thymidylate kinase
MKNKIIMIEGTDGSGKTTVCNLLSEKLNIPILKMPRMKKYFDKNITEEMSELFNRTIVQFNNFSFILDRGYVSSLVYSKIYNREFDLNYIDVIEEQLKPQIFVLTVGEEEMFRRREKDEIINDLMRVKIREEYVKISEERNYKIIDTTNITPDQVCNKILENL